MELSIVNIAGEDTGRKVTLNDSIFNVESNDHAIYLDVKQYLANNRQGTSKTKERGEITGSTRKIKKQKGTGTARAGSIKSPIFRGGGRIFGPQPRNYRFKLNKKLKLVARKSALSYKANSNNIKVLESASLEAPKTKEFVKFTSNLEINNKKLLLVLNEQNKNIYLSSRNLKDVKVVTISDINTYDIMKASVVVFEEKTMEPLQKMFRI